MRINNLDAEGLRILQPIYPIPAQRESLVGRAVRDTLMSHNGIDCHHP